MSEGKVIVWLAGVTTTSLQVAAAADQADGTVGDAQP